MSKRLGNIERVKGYLTIKNNNYKFDLVGTNYEITGSEKTFGNNVVIIGTDLKKDKLKTLFRDYTRNTIINSNIIRIYYFFMCVTFIKTILML